MEMSTVKTVAVFIIIFGCFAVLYPKIFHPIFMHMLGSAPKKQTTDDVLNRIPPHLRHGRPMGAPEDTMRNMRAGSHPGLRAAAEMKKQAATSTPGGGRGMMSIVLPMYAVGIIVYLVYTLSKVFGKKEKPPGEDYLSNDPFKDIRYDAEKHKFSHKGDEEEEEEEEVDPEIKEYRKSNSKKRDLEDLLLKADERSITEMEMHQLKTRLLETETQMNRILKAMETVQRQVGQTAEDHMSQQARAAMEELKKEKDRLTDLSPDLASYDIISGGSSPIENIGPMDVNTENIYDGLDVTSRNVTNAQKQFKQMPKKSKRQVAKDRRSKKRADTDEESDGNDDRETSEEEEEVFRAKEEKEERKEEIIDSKEESSDDDHPDLRLRKTVKKQKRAVRQVDTRKKAKKQRNNSDAPSSVSKTD